VRYIRLWTSIAASMLLAAGIGLYSLIRETPQTPLLSDASIEQANERTDERANERMDGILEEKKTIVMEKAASAINQPETEPEAPSAPSVLESVAKVERVAPQPQSDVQSANLQVKKNELDMSAIQADETSMQADNSQLEEVEVIAYGKMKKSALTKNDDKNTPSEPLTGKHAYARYLKKRLIRPADTCANVKGTVIVRFDINEHGRPYNLTIVQSLCETADREAMRLINEGCDWTQSGQATIEVKF
jgi:outer membrane biosynthesis protein TonB